MANLKKEEALVRLATATDGQVETAAKAKSFKPASIAQYRNRLRVALNSLPTGGDSGIDESILPAPTVTPPVKAKKARTPKTPAATPPTVTAVATSNVPQKPTATPDDKKVTLTWPAVNEATKYYIRRKIGQDNLFVAETTTNTKVVDDLKNGEEITFVITAIGSWGESQPSESVNITPNKSVPTATASSSNDPRKIAEAWWETVVEVGIAILAIIGMFLSEGMSMVLFIVIGILALVAIFGPMIAKRIKER